MSGGSFADVSGVELRQSRGERSGVRPDVPPPRGRAAQSEGNHEDEAIELINELLNKHLLECAKYKPKRFYMIRNDRFMENIGAASKQNPSPGFRL